MENIKLLRTRVVCPFFRKSTPVQALNTASELMLRVISEADERSLREVGNFLFFMEALANRNKYLMFHPAGKKKKFAPEFLGAVLH